MQSRVSAAGARAPCPRPAKQVEGWPIGRLIPHANKRPRQSEARLDKLAATIVGWGEMLACQSMSVRSSVKPIGRAPSRPKPDQLGAAHGEKSISRN
jgi:hypothetical protein